VRRQTYGYLIIRRTVLFLCLSSETSLNIFFSHRTSTPSAFEVITEKRYINYLLTYLVTYTTKNCATNGSERTLASIPLHFKPADYVAEHGDTNDTRRKRKSSGTFVRRRLKPDAVPSVLENVQEYLSNTSGMPRSTASATPYPVDVRKRQ